VVSVVTRLRWCAPVARLQVVLQYLRSVTVIRGQDLVNRCARERCSVARTNRLLLGLLFGIDLYGSDGNEFRLFEGSLESVFIA
jgi:hypothetical protein